MLFHLVALMIFLATSWPICKAQKSGLKVNIREIPLNPFNSSDGNYYGCFLTILFRQCLIGTCSIPFYLSPLPPPPVLEIGVMLFIIDLEAFKELEMGYRIDYMIRQVWWPHTKC